MDSGNSGSISSSGDEEYDSRADTVPTFLNPSLTQFSSMSHQPHSSLILSSHPQTHHPSLFDLSPSYLLALSQSQPNSSNPNSILNLETGNSQRLRSEPNCTDPANLPGVSSSSQSAAAATTTPQALGHDDNARVSAQTNVVRSSKKRTRASRRAPTTVLTTDTTNFRAMVQEFTGIPAPPFSGSSYSRRLDLLTGSSSLRSTQLDTTGPNFYPLRPSPHKLHPNPLLLSSSSSPPSTLLHSNMVDAIASTTNTADNSAPSIHFQLPPDLGLPYNNQSPSQNLLSMQNHPILAFQSPPLHPFSNPLPGFGAKSQGNLSVPSLEDLGIGHGQVNAHLMSGASVGPSHGHVTNSATMPLRSDDDGYRDIEPSADGRRDQYYSKVGGGSCKLNFSASSSSGFNHEKTTTLENTSTRGEGAVESWICSSD